MRVLLKSPIGPGGIFCGAAHGVVWCDKNYGNTKFFFVSVKFNYSAAIRATSPCYAWTCHCPWQPRAHFFFFVFVTMVLILLRDARTSRRLLPSHVRLIEESVLPSHNLVLFWQVNELACNPLTVSKAAATVTTAGIFISYLVWGKQWSSSYQARVNARNFVSFSSRDK